MDRSHLVGKYDQDLILDFRLGTDTPEDLITVPSLLVGTVTNKTGC